MRAKKASNAPTHFHEDASERKPPACWGQFDSHAYSSALTMGPIAGPRKGATAKRLYRCQLVSTAEAHETYPMADPRSAALNISAMIPLPLLASFHVMRVDTDPVDVRHEAPKVPAKNRRTIKASRLFAPQQAALNAVKAVNVVQNMIRRPNTSEHGAHINGPTTNPSTNPDVTDMSM